MSFAKKPSLSSQAIIDAYKAHGDKFLTIDVNNIRAYKSFAQYINIVVKKADGTIAKDPYQTISNNGITTSSNIREPSSRLYEQIRLAFSKLNVDVEEIDIEAMAIMCNSYKVVFNKMVDDKIVTHRREDTRKKNAKGKAPILLISTEAKTPMQTTTVNKNTQDLEELPNPVFWVNVPKKRYRKGTNPKLVQFGDLHYKDDDGADGEPFYIQDFNITFYDIEQGYFDKKTGKPLFQKLGDLDEDDNAILNNTNIHTFIPSGSTLCGALEYGVTVSARGAKLDISLYGSSYVKRGEEQQHAVVSDDDIAAFAAKCNISSKKDTKPKKNVETSDGEDAEASAASDEDSDAQSDVEITQEDEYFSDN